MELQDLGCIAYTPELCGSAFANAACEHLLAIRRECCESHWQADLDVGSAFAIELEDACCAIVTCGDQGVAVRCYANVTDLLAVVADLAAWLKFW